MDEPPLPVDAAEEVGGLHSRRVVLLVAAEGHDDLDARDPREVARDGDPDVLAADRPGAGVRENVLPGALQSPPSRRDGASRGGRSSPRRPGATLSTCARDHAPRERDKKRGSRRQPLSLPGSPLYDIPSMAHDTDIGGPGGGRFPATRHSAVLAAQSTDLIERERGLAILLETYWRPAYKYVRIRFGESNEDAKDLTQSFFMRALEKDFFDGYDPEKGSFRTYLRTCLDRFVAQREEGRRPREALAGRSAAAARLRGRRGRALAAGSSRSRVDGPVLPRRVGAEPLRALGRAAARRVREARQGPSVSALRALRARPRPRREADLRAAGRGVRHSARRR